MWGEVMVGGRGGMRRAVSGAEGALCSPTWRGTVLGPDGIYVCAGEGLRAIVAVTRTTALGVDEPVVLR